MGILIDQTVLAPLKDAQEELGVRLDALLVELRTIRVLLETALGTELDGAERAVNVSNGSKGRAKAS